MLRTRLTDMFQMRYPIISAPMARTSGGVLAAAVSIEGGLGTFSLVRINASCLKTLESQALYMLGLIMDATNKMPEEILP